MALELQGGFRYLTVKVVFTKYVKSIKAAEKLRPVAERRRIPTVREFAEYCKLTPPGFSKIAQNKTLGVSKQFMDGTLGLFHACGFDNTTFDDILEYKK